MLTAVPTLTQAINQVKPRRALSTTHPQIKSQADRSQAEPITTQRVPREALFTLNWAQLLCAAIHVHVVGGTHSSLHGKTQAALHTHAGLIVEFSAIGWIGYALLARVIVSSFTAGASAIGVLVAIADHHSTLRTH